MTTNQTFKSRYAEARAQQELKQRFGQTLKAYRRTAPNAEFVTMKVVGQKALQDCLDTGWELLTQDVSLHGQWVRQFIVRKSTSAIRLDLEANGVV